MKQQFIITLLAGILLGILLCLIARPVGLYQVSATQNHFAVVNTVTGQVWLRPCGDSWSKETITDYGTPRNPKIRERECPPMSAKERRKMLYK
jgi:hypothetical protein